MRFSICSLPSARTIMVASIFPRRLPKFALECTIEGCLRLISDFSGDFGNASWRTLKRPRCQLKSPARQICHGWFGEISRKAFDQGGPGNAYFLRKVGDCPRMGNAAVEQSEASPDDGIACAREPSRLLLGH